MSDFIKKWKVTATLLTPLHIGSGELLDTFSCVYADGKLHEFDLNRAMQDQNADSNVKRDLMNRLEGTLASVESVRQIRKLLAQLPWQEHVLRSFDLSDDIRDKLERNEFEVPPGTDIQLFARNPLTRRIIIPGSSIKGAIRTAVVAERAKKMPADNVSERLFEAKVLGYTHSDRRRNGLKQDIERDPFGEWSVSDAELDATTMLIGAVIHKRVPERKGKARQKAPPSFDNWVEVVVPGKKGFSFTFELTWKRRGTAEKSEIKARIGFGEIVRAIKKHTNRTFEETFPVEIDFSTMESDDDFNQFNECCKQIEDAIKQVRSSDNQCVLALGRFTGFLVKTVEKQRVLKAHQRKGSDRRGEEANPVTRVLTDGQEPFGYLKLKFEEMK